MINNTTYMIRIRGKLSVNWQQRFEPLILHTDGDVTILQGEITDQAMLYGILFKIQSLGLELVDVQRISFSYKEEI